MGSRDPVSFKRRCQTISTKHKLVNNFNASVSIHGFNKEMLSKQQPRFNKQANFEPQLKFINRKNNFNSYYLMNFPMWIKNSAKSYNKYNVRRSNCRSYHRSELFIQRFGKSIRPKYIQKKNIRNNVEFYKSNPNSVTYCVSNDLKKLRRMSTSKKGNKKGANESQLNLLDKKSNNCTSTESNIVETKLHFVISKDRLKLKRLSATMNSLPPMIGYANGSLLAGRRRLSTSQQYTLLRTSFALNRSKLFAIRKMRKLQQEKRFGLKTVVKKREFCKFFNRYGRCMRGSRCLYLHDAARVSVCKRFLRGTCNISDCPFAHELNKSKMPVCAYFLRGRCTRDSCPYLHVKHSDDAPICQQFLKGYCPLGENCDRKHELVKRSFHQNYVKTATRHPQQQQKHKAKSEREKKSISSSNQISLSESLPSFIPLKTDDCDDAVDDEDDQRYAPLPPYFASLIFGDASARFDNNDAKLLTVS